MIIVVTLMQTSSYGDTPPSVSSCNCKSQEIQPCYPPPPGNGAAWFHSNNECKHSNENSNDIDSDVKLQRHTATCVFSQLQLSGNTAPLRPSPGNGGAWFHSDNECKHGSNYTSNDIDENIKSRRHTPPCAFSQLRLSGNTARLRPSPQKWWDMIS